MQSTTIQKSEVSPVPGLDRWVSFAQLRATLGLSSNTLRRMFESGNFPRPVFGRPGQKLMWSERAVREWQEEQETQVA